MNDNVLPAFIDALDRAFSLDEARELAFALGVDWDNLAGQGKRARLLSLVEDCQRSGTLTKLVQSAAERRPTLEPFIERVAHHERQPALPIEPRPRSTFRTGLTLVAGFVLVLVAAVTAAEILPRLADAPPATTRAAPDVLPKLEPVTDDLATQDPQCAPPAGTPRDLGATRIVTGVTDFAIGDERSPSANGKPKTRVDIQTFAMDRYEVTNLEFRQFIAATGRTPPEAWADPNYLTGKDLMPVVDVTWQEANAYCQWAGKRLPTQEEWELACRGPDDGRMYPWGQAWEPCRANTAERGIGAPWIIGSTSFASAAQASGDSPFGIADLAGNVAEWTSSPFSETDHFVRGGSFTDEGDAVTCVLRMHAESEVAYGEVGFRCVTSP